MPLDKPKSGTAAKPFTPTLSTAFRNTKSPLTPRLAGSKNGSPISPPRRNPRSETAPPSSRREDFRSPTQSQLDVNVTPRSGARRSRIGADSPSTPASTGVGTPSKSRPFSAIELHQPGRHHGPNPGLGLTCPEKSTNTPSPAPNSTKAHMVTGGLGRRGSMESLPNVTPQSQTLRFFQANDGQSCLVSEPEQFRSIKKEDSPMPLSHVAEKATFSPASHTTSHLSLEPEGRQKFFHANDRPTGGMSRPRTLASSVTAGGPYVSSPDPQSPNSPRSTTGLQQPPSPLKAASLRSAPATVIGLASQKSVQQKNVGILAQPKESVVPADTLRRTSVSSQTSTVRQRTHRKLAHSISRPPTPPERLDLHISPEVTPTKHSPKQIASPPSPVDRMSPGSTSLSSSNTGFSTQTVDSTPSNPLHPLSPTKSDTPQPTQLQRTNEAAATARRERKVLDLEISNSSLLAINKTLEREMRKQSTELRRFRRLSRAGQLSIGRDSLRSTSGQTEMSTLPESEEGDGSHGSLSDPEEMNSSEDNEDDLDSSFDDDSSALSPTSRTAHDARQRTRDEKRLVLDLKKHHQLLIDSQKMNQSIKRCLSWTEDLISEGRKALDYHVKVSDVKLGGKVLVPDPDDEEEGEEDGGGDSSGKSLLSPSLPVAPQLDVQQGKNIWMQGLEQIEMEVDKMLASSSTLKAEIPAL